MKRLFTAFILVTMSTLLWGQTGTWSGQIEVQGMKLTLVFHLDGDEPTLDSPDQGVKGIPVQYKIEETGKVSVTVPMIGASYEGLWMGTQIVGNFSQSGLSLPLTLSPGLNKPNRPQTPVGPFPYSQEEVSFSNGEAKLTGTLILPQGCNRQTPVLIMVNGSGQQDRDETIFDHKPFAVIADALGRAGIATLRYDDRGIGGSIGDVKNATTVDFKDDALAGIELLRERFDKVGVLGHSEGGTIAMMLAAEKQVDFIVSLAGAVVSGQETIVKQIRLSLVEAGYPDQTVDEYCNAVSKAAYVRIHGGMMPSVDELNLPDELKQNFLGVLTMFQMPWMIKFLSLDMRPLLGSIECPVLALNGTKDSQVEAEANLAPLRSSLPENSRNRIEALEGLNHLLQHCSTGSVSEYREIEETISPEVLKIIADWLTVFM